MNREFLEIPKSLKSPNENATLVFDYLERKFKFLVDSPQPQAPIPEGIARMAKLEHYLRQAKRDGTISCYHTQKTFYRVERHLIYRLYLIVDGVEVESSSGCQLLEDAYWSLAERAIKSMPKWGKMSNLPPPKPVEGLVFDSTNVNIIFILILVELTTL